MNNKEIRDFIKQTCCPFLAARKGYWISAESPKEKYMKGKNFHLQNAYKYLKSQEYSIKRGMFLQGLKYDIRHKEQIIDWASEAYDRKIEELEDAMND